ncbi:DNA binding protein, putative [Ricinus communis]|uniref:DNA binding protein, putative n=2 Tax=Ricinus communis TaxID=3988 RepID=B9RLH1_RICCO|nr:DNA binding protein, putative [Ricinus communis]
MEPHEIKGFHYPPHANSSVPGLLSLSPTDNTLSYANLSQNPESSSSFFSRSFPSNSPIHFPLHIFSTNTSPASADSSLNKTSNHQVGNSHERKLKRMISNRESARRSRIRKKKQIEELDCQVNHLRTMNHQLSEKVIHLLENNQQILQENSQLKERVSSLQLVLSDLLIPMRNVEESICNPNRLRGETSN